jgi:hypothetical protein
MVVLKRRGLMLALPNGRCKNTTIEVQRLPHFLNCLFQRVEISL